MAAVLTCRLGRCKRTGFLDTRCCGDAAAAATGAATATATAGAAAATNATPRPGDAGKKAGVLTPTARTQQNA